ncbi:hypothetical protein B9C99_11895 [Rhodococcus sp. BUPNP1]|nr:hypothetical protein B9C99_11895 [Rhodococcus sp. BUPNP1]
MRTSARLLYDVLASVYDRLGFDILDDAVFEVLVSAGFACGLTVIPAPRMSLSLTPILRAPALDTLPEPPGRSSPLRMRPLI